MPSSLINLQNPNPRASLVNLVSFFTDFDTENKLSFDKGPELLNPRVRVSKEVIASNEEERASDFVAAKLYYKMLTYKFAGTEEGDEYESNFNETKSRNSATKFNTEEDEY